MSTPCAGGAGAGETETISYSTAFTETILGTGSVGYTETYYYSTAYTETIHYTETVSAPAVTAAPSGVSPEATGAITTVYVTQTATVCGCE